MAYLVRLRSVTVVLILLGMLVGCRGYGSTYWLATAPLFDVERYLGVQSNQRICDLASRGTFTTEIQAIDRALKEYNRRGLSPRRCSPVYLTCLDLGIVEETPSFAKCLIETRNTIALQDEMKKMRREYENARRESELLRRELEEERRRYHEKYDGKAAPKYMHGQ